MVDETADLERLVGAAARREVAGDGVDAEAADREQRREAGAVLGDERADSRSSQSWARAPSSTPAAPTPTRPRNTRRPTGVPVTSAASPMSGRSGRGWLVGHHTKGTEPERRIGSRRRRDSEVPGDPEPSTTKVVDDGRRTRGDGSDGHQRDRSRHPGLRRRAAPPRRRRVRRGAGRLQRR